MDVNEKYQLLLKLKDKLQAGDKAVAKRVSKLWNNKLIYKIAEKSPANTAELMEVQGMTKEFSNEFGALVMHELGKSMIQGYKTLTKSEANIIDKLSHKLISIDKSNRLLYSPFLTPTTDFDLVGAIDKDKIEPLLFGQKNSVVLVDLSVNTGRDNNTLEKLKSNLDNLTMLRRNVEARETETGHYNMYIGYPFVQGRLQGQDFDVKAPLMLFPVRLETSLGMASIKRDETREIIYNHPLILANNKDNNVATDELPTPDFSNLNKNNFVDHLVRYFASHGFFIKDYKFMTEKYPDHGSDNFPLYKNGELYVKQYMVLGEFDIYFSDINKEVKKIVNGGVINKSLRELLLDTNNNLSQYGEDQDFKESQFHYINDLNFYQERIITDFKKGKNLIIFGPPGTGKSQTITSLISDALLSNKRVLMVSEKKAALDVIYSRLGNLSNFSILIDNAANKQKFYEQLNGILKYKTMSTTSTDIDRLLDETISSIEQELIKLDSVAENMFKTNSEFGIEIYKLYRSLHRLNLEDANVLTNYQIVLTSTPDNLRKIQYYDLLKLYKRFNNTDFLQMLDYNLTLDKNLPFIKIMNDQLTSLDILNLQGVINEIKTIETADKKKVREMIGKLSPFVQNGTAVDFITLVQNAPADFNILNYYESYIKNKHAMKSFSQLEREYCDFMFTLTKKTDLAIPEMNNFIFRSIVYSFIDRFESKDRTTPFIVNTYQGIKNNLDELFERRKDLTEKKLYLKLAQTFNECPRIEEMKSRTETKFKWSIKKFLSHFYEDLFSSIRTWFMTPESVSKVLPLITDMFDVVIFDEASQLFLEKTIPSIYRAKQIVVSGDEKQLRPNKLGLGRINFQGDEDFVYNDVFIQESLLDLSKLKFTAKNLKYHYRSKYQELIAFSNAAFYNDELITSPNVVEPSTPPIEYIKVDNGQWIKNKNKAEADRIAELLSTTLKTRKNKETIGIITFNSGQRDEILNRLEKECQNDPEFAKLYHSEINRVDKGQNVGLFVKNIENVQGDERDIIIFSIGYAKGENGKVTRNFGWLNQENGETRLNVAITRSKDKIYIVASIEPSELIIDDLTYKGAYLLKKYLEYSKAISDNNPKLAGVILKDVLGKTEVTYEPNEVVRANPMVEELYTHLVSAGLKVKKNVGFSGYTIDLAILDDQNNYVLGIESDSKVYNSHKITRERDYHVPKYLETRGWKIHRIWAINWWKDKDTEIRRVLTLIQKHAPQIRLQETSQPILQKPLVEVKSMAPSNVDIDLDDIDTLDDSSLLISKVNMS